MPERARRRRRGGRVLAVVRAADERLGGQRVVGCELDARPRRERARAARARPLRRRALFSKMRSFAARYASKVAVAVEVVGLRFSSTATSQRSVVHVLELEARELADDQRRPARPVPSSSHSGAADVAGRDRARAEDRAEQLARRRLPVRAGDAHESAAGRAAKPSSTSLQTGMPRCRAASTTSGASPRTPGLFTSTSTPSSSETSVVRRLAELRRPRLEASPRRAGSRSAPTTATPRRTSTSAAARPSARGRARAARPG